MYKSWLNALLKLAFALSTTTPRRWTVNTSPVSFSPQQKRRRDNQPRRSITCFQLSATNVSSAQLQCIHFHAVVHLAFTPSGSVPSICAHSVKHSTQSTQTRRSTIATYSVTVVNNAATLQQDYSYSTCPVASGLLQRRAGRSSSLYTGTAPVSPACSGTHRSGSQAAWPCDFSSSRVALVASRWEDQVQAVLAGSQVASGTHAGIYLRPSDIGSQYSRSIYNLWQPRRVADTSTNWRQSLFCCCTASMEQATVRFPTELKLLRSTDLFRRDLKKFFLLFCLWAPRYGLTLWWAFGFLVGGAIQVPQLQLYEPCT